MAVFFCSQSSHLISLIYPLTARIIGAPQIISQSVSSILPCSPLPSGTWWTAGLSIPWCCLPTSPSVCLILFPLSLCLARHPKLACQKKIIFLHPLKSCQKGLRWWEPVAQLLVYWTSRNTQPTQVPPWLVSRYFECLPQKPLRPQFPKFIQLKMTVCGSQR